MKLLWLCNLMPGDVKRQVSGDPAAGGLWMDHVLAGLRQRGLTLHILCPGDGKAGALDDRCSYATFREGLPHRYLPELEVWFRQELEAFRPEVIHIWGTEYAHTLAMVNAVEARNLLDHAVVSIQGLCSVYSGHYAEGVPSQIQRACTFRDAVRRDNIRQQQKKFALRGALEVEALRKVRHVTGRTDWDRACTAKIHPEATYHFCNETLREEFYSGQWRYELCQAHRVFASSCVYPVKGFHYLLEAFAGVARDYPDATLAVPGRSFLTADRLHRTAYQRYLADMARELGVAEKIEFLGSLSAQGMKEAFLGCNVFVLPSTIENSPNSLGEAMLLGVPCIASNVGGVTNLLSAPAEGYVYQSTAPYMLEYYLRQVFTLGAEAAVLGQAARDHALATHDPQRNLDTLLAIYQTLI